MSIFRKFEFKFPKKSKIVLIGITNKKIASDIVNKDFIIINLDKFNFFVLIKLFFLNGIKINDFRLNYLEHYLKFIGANILICSEDNNPLYWRIKEKLPELKVLIIQNGWRMKKFDIFESRIIKRDEYKVDYFFTFNSSISKLYSKFIKAKFIEIGSIENNFYNINNEIKKQGILYLSEYFETNRYKEKLYTPKKLKWFNTEIILLPFLKSFCSKNNISLNILPRIGSKNEFNFFEKILGKNSDWNYLKKISNSYKFVDEAKVIIFSATTLGYESLARKKKVLGFCCKLLSDPSRNFGWPMYYKKKEGFFWINYIHLNRFQKKLNNLIKMNNYEWLRKSKKYQKNLMVYDKNNFKLKKIIESL